MIGQFVHGRVAVFIDAANIFYSQRTLGWRIDYEQLVAYLKRETSLADIRYYTGIIEQQGKQKGFLKALESFGYTVIAKEVKLIHVHDGEMVSKGNLDIELAIDAYMRRDSYDTLVLFSGDSDFAYLLDVLKRNGKRIIVISSRGHVSKELIVRSRYVPLSKLKGVIARAPKFKEPDVNPAPEVKIH